MKNLNQEAAAKTKEPVVLNYIMEAILLQLGPRQIPSNKTKDRNYSSAAWERQVPMNSSSSTWLAIAESISASRGSNWPSMAAIICRCMLRPTSLSWSLRITDRCLHGTQGLLSWFSLWHQDFTKSRETYGTSSGKTNSKTRSPTKSWRQICKSERIKTST